MHAIRLLITTILLLVVSSSANAFSVPSTWQDVLSNIQTSRIQWSSNYDNTGHRSSIDVATRRWSSFGRTPSESNTSGKLATFLRSLQTKFSAVKAVEPAPSSRTIQLAEPTTLIIFLMGAIAVVALRRRNTR